MVELHSCNASIRLITWRHTISTIWNNKHPSQSHSQGTRNPVSLSSVTEDWSPAFRRSSCLTTGDHREASIHLQNLAPETDFAKSPRLPPSEQMLLKLRGGWLAGHHDSPWKARGWHQRHPQHPSGSISFSILILSPLTGMSLREWLSVLQICLAGLNPGAQEAILTPIQTRLCPSLEILRGGF